MNMDRSSCIEFIRRNIPDAEVRKLLFCGDFDDEDEFLTDRDQILKYYSPIINLTFTYLYSRYRYWKDQGAEETYTNSTNFQRTIKTFDSLYGTYDLSFELMENLILDYQLDSHMEQLIKRTLDVEGIELNNDFSKYAYKARKYRRTSRLSDELNIADQRDELIGFLRCFPYLRDLKIRTELVPDVTKADVEFAEPKPYDKVKHVYLEYDNDFSRSGRVELDTFGQIEVIEREYYYLERIEVHSDVINKNTKSLMLNYTQIGDYDLAKTIIIENEDDGFNNEIPTIRGEGVSELYYLSLIPGDITLEEGSKILKDLHAINYKYVKNLALSLSDVLSDTSKAALMRIYESTYPELFDKTNDEDSDWDKIISIIIIKENVNNVLKNIFESDYECYKTLIQNLEIRFGADRINSKGLISTIRMRCASTERNTAARAPLINANRTLANKAEITADTIIESLARAVNSNEINEAKEYNFPLDMKGRIEYLQELMNSGISLQEKITILQSIVRQTFKSIICFYEGLFAFSEVKRNFEDDSYYKILTHEEVVKYQEATESQFRQRVEEVKAELADARYSTLQSIMERVGALCHKCVSESGEQAHCGKLLKDLLGRSYVLDYEKVKDIEQYLTNIRAEEEFYNSVSMVQDIFRYLASGSNQKQNITSIYPYVGTYEYINYGKDGFKVERFTVITDKKPIDIEILSEFSYKIGNRFFILPNVSRSSENIWIDPVVININDFDLENHPDGQ